MPQENILALSQEIDTADVAWLIDYVACLTGPDDFMDNIDEYDAADNARSEVIAKGFFLLIDLVSALILTLGDHAIEEAQRFEKRQAHYVPWVIKYCTDKRFTKEIRTNFPFLTI